MSQNADILALLQSGRRLTPLDALELCRCFRLAARIKDLRDDGHDIRMELIEVGDQKHVACYWLHREPVQTTLFGEAAE